MARRGIAGTGHLNLGRDRTFLLWYDMVQHSGLGLSRHLLARRIQIRYEAKRMNLVQEVIYMHKALAVLPIVSALLCVAATAQANEPTSACSALEFEAFMQQNDLFYAAEHQALRDTDTFRTWFTLTHELAAINPPHESSMPPRWYTLVAKLAEVERALEGSPLLAQVQALDACRSLESTTERWRTECTAGSRIPAPCLSLSALLGPIWRGSFPNR